MALKEVAMKQKPSECEGSMAIRAPVIVFQMVCVMDGLMGAI